MSVEGASALPRRELVEVGLERGREPRMPLAVADALFGRAHAIRHPQRLPNFARSQGIHAGGLRIRGIWELSIFKTARGAIMAINS